MKMLAKELLKSAAVTAALLVGLMLLSTFLDKVL